jgi:hypothetical protein
MQGLEGVPSAAIEPIPDYFSPRRLRVANCVTLGLADKPFVAGFRKGPWTRSSVPSQCGSRQSRPK